MAETQEQEPVERTPPPMPAGPSTSDLFGGIDDSYKKVSVDLAKLVDRKIIKDDAIADQTEARMEQDRGIAKRHLEAQGVIADKLEPWDAKQKSEEFYTDPIQAFGSLASVFGIIASAFTHAPMENALNASAAAMNAVKSNNAQEYERAHTAWKENMDLVQKRFNMEQTQYRDALDLMKTDQSAGETKLKAAAIRFNDQKTLALLSAGLLPELIDARAGITKAAEGLVKVQEAMDKQYYQKSAAMQMHRDGKSDDEIYHRLYAPVGSMSLGTMKAQMIREEIAANPGDPAAALRKVEGIFNPLAAARNLPATYATEAIENLEKGGVVIEPQTKALIQSTIGKAANSQRAAEVNGRVAAAIDEIQTIQEKDGEIPPKQVSQILRDAMAVQAQSKIDQGIINELKKYPQMDRNKLGYVGAQNQTRIINSLQSAEQIEHIAGYVAENPEALGLLADAARKMNLDAYQGMMKDPQTYLQKVTLDRDALIDQAARAQRLPGTVAEKAKVLNKLLATQAFADAAQAGSRGATIYLDKAFREIYQQASSLPAFYEVLHQREWDANNHLRKYNMGLDDRSDIDKVFPFWQEGSAGFIARAAKKTKPTGSNLPKPGEGGWIDLGGVRIRQKPTAEAPAETETPP